MKKIAIYTFLLTFSLILVIVICLSYSVQGNYYSPLYAYLDGGEYYIKIKDGKVWQCGENSSGKVNDLIATYTADPGGGYRFTFIRDNSSIIVFTSILGLKISDSDSIKLNIKKSKLGVDFIRIL